MKDKLTKKSEAKERQEEYNKLTTTQKVVKLDLLFGGGLGAKKERAKLALKSVKEAEGRIAKVIETAKAITKAEKSGKPYQKPKRS